MYRFSKERRAFIIFLSLFLLSALIITVDYNDRGFFGLIKDAGVTLYKPVNQAIFKTVNNIVDYFHIFTEAEKIREQNEQLRTEIQTISRENAINKEKLAAYDRLVSMMKLEDYYSYEMIGAQVIGREPDNWFHNVIVDRGIKHGVEVDMGVANYSGLVGKVIQSEQNSSQVLLLLDQGCSIGAMVQRSREIGVVKGGTDGKYCFLDYIAHDADIQINDFVVTSGMGSSVPKGIRIGQVVAIKKEKHDLFQRILVKPEVDFNKLEEVFVVKQPE